MEFKGKIALVTGASSGIGYAVACEFFKVGAKVVIADISEKGEEVRDYIKKQGGDALFVKSDVSKWEDQENVMEQIKKHYGKLDYVNNNAGIEHAPTNIADLEEKTWDRVLEVNLKGVWLGMKMQIPYLIKNGGGVIINTSSAAGLKALPGMGAYNCSKAAVVMLTKTAALEYAAQNIRVNALCPGLVMTAMIERVAKQDPTFFEEQILKPIPLRKGAKPEDIAKMVVWLCSPTANFITGQCLTPDGGYMLS